MSAASEVSWRVERTMQESGGLPFPEGEKEMKFTAPLSL